LREAGGYDMNHEKMGYEARSVQWGYETTDNGDVN